MKIKVNFGNLARQASGNDGAPQFQISFDQGDKKRKRPDDAAVNGEAGQPPAGANPRTSGRTAPRVTKIKLPAAPSPFGSSGPGRTVPKLPITQQSTPRLPIDTPAYNGSAAPGSASAPYSSKSTPGGPIFGRTTKLPLGSEPRPSGISLPPTSSGKFKAKIKLPSSASLERPADQRTKLKYDTLEPSGSLQATPSNPFSTKITLKATPSFKASMPAAFGGTPGTRSPKATPGSGQRGPPLSFKGPKQQPFLPSSQQPPQRSTFQMKSFLGSAPSSAPPSMAPKPPPSSTPTKPQHKRLKHEPSFKGDASPPHSLGPPRPTTSLATSMDTRGAVIKKIKITLPSASSAPAKSESLTVGSPSAAPSHRGLRDRDRDRDRDTPEDSVISGGRFGSRRQRERERDRFGDRDRERARQREMPTVSGGSEPPPQADAAAAAATAGAAQPAAPPKPVGPPKPQQLQTLVEKLQQRDKNNIFRDPVTESVAPGYFSVVKRPMDFSSIKRKLIDGRYGEWDDLHADINLMFDNAMLYNPPDSFFHMEARKLKEVGASMVEQAKAGNLSGRGKIGSIMRKVNAEMAKEQLQREREQQRQRRPKQRRQVITQADDYYMDMDEMLPSRRGRRPASEPESRRMLLLDENARASYKSRAPSTLPATCWGGLAGGASAEGLPFAAGRPGLATMFNNAAGMPPDAYSSSLARFVAGCSEKVQQLVMHRLVKCVPVAGSQAKPDPAAVQAASLAGAAASGGLGAPVASQGLASAARPVVVDLTGDRGALQPAGSVGVKPAVQAGQQVMYGGLAGMQQGQVSQAQLLASQQLQQLQQLQQQQQAGQNAAANSIQQAVSQQLLQARQQAGVGQLGMAQQAATQQAAAGAASVQLNMLRQATGQQQVLLPAASLAGLTGGGTLINTSQGLMRAMSLNGQTVLVPAGNLQGLQQQQVLQQLLQHNQQVALQQQQQNMLGLLPSGMLSGLTQQQQLALALNRQQQAGGQK